jgi:hypothetical protein
MGDERVGRTTSLAIFLAVFGKREKRGGLLVRRSETYAGLFVYGLPIRFLSRSRVLL